MIDGNTQVKAVCLVVTGNEIPAVQREDGTGGREPGPLVAIDEGVISDQGFHEDRGFVVQCRVELDVTVACPRAIHRGFEQVMVSKPMLAPSLFNQTVVDKEHLLSREELHAVPMPRALAGSDR